MLNTDSLFLGGAALADAGYYPLSKKPSRANRRTTEAEDPKPGLLHYMAVSLPLKRIYTHGEYGIIERAKETVYNGSGPDIVRLPEKEPDNIEYLPPSWRRFMVREPSPLYNAYYPGELIIASVDREYDTAALDELLSHLRANNPQFKASVMKKEPLDPQLVKKYGIKELATTWEEYLDSKEFREYYQQRLARLFKEFRRRPYVPGFTGREKELAALDRAVQRFAFVNVSGGVGVGKSALLARLADKKESALTIAWIQAETRNISKAEVLVSLAIQLDLLSSPEVLEKENLETYLPQLEGDIEKRLREEEVLIIFDSLDPYLRQGRYVFKNQDLEDLLSRWVTERGLLGKSRLVFTADLRPDRRGEDSFKELKTALSNAAGNRERKIILRGLEDSLRCELFLDWLKPLSQEADFQKKAYRLYKIEDKNLRLLRLLALWACEAGGMAKIEEDLKAVEETRPWNKENLVYGFLFKVIGSQKQVILKTLQWIGRPVPRSVICSSAGMAPALDELIAQGLVIPGPGNETVEPVYRFAGREERGTPLDKAGEQAAVREIRSFRRLIDISERDTARAADFHRGGNSLCENTGFWDEWQDYALLNLSGFVSRAKFLVKQAKSARLSPQQKKAMARRALDYCLKSIAAGVELGDGHFFCAQAKSLVYPNSHDQEIKEHYETSISIHPHADKHSRYAIFLYKRPGDFEQAEKQFKKARQLEARRKRMNIFGLHSQAEFYLHWRDHEQQAGDTINSIIGLKENRLQNFFLAARLFWEMGLRYSAAFFFEESLKIDPDHIQVLNSYANACVEWGDKEKAVQLFEKSLAVDSKHVPTLNSYANACVGWGDKAKAVELFEAALKVQPENVQVLNSYANACVEWGDKGDKAKAVQLFEKSLSVDSKHVPTLNSYANACVEWGNKAKAAAFFDKALALEPRNEIVLKSYAKAQEKWGNKEKSREFLEKAKAVEKEKSAAKAAPPPPPAKEIKEPAPETAAMTAKSEAPKTVPAPTIPAPSSVPAAPAPAPAAAVAAAPVPAAPVKESPAPFTFTDQEIAWLSNYDGKHRSWTGALDWAAFGMLYPLFYLSGELESAADLGYLPSMEREYLRLYHTVNDLYHIMSRAVSGPAESPEPPAQHFSWKDDWFNREGKPLDLIAYFDREMLRHAQNPVCAAFLCQSLETNTWDNIAAIIRKEALEWIQKDSQKWLPFMSKRTVNLFSVQGKEAFLTFLKEQAPAGEEPVPVTRESVSRFIDRFSIKWQDSFTYFPWEQLTPDERTRVPDKLLSLVERVRDILKDLTEQKEGAFDRLAKFVHQDIQVAVDLMGRLDEYQYQFNIPTPIPLHVSGEILEIKEDFLRVVIEHSGDEDYEKDIPRADFPEENPRVGQRFFAKIDKDRPDVVYGIDPLPYRKLTIDELIISLFGKEVYDKVSPYWEKEES